MIHTSEFRLALEDARRRSLEDVPVTDDEGLLLYALLKNRGARSVIEVGRHAGVSTLWIAAALSTSGVLWSFDPDPVDDDALRSNLDSIGAARKSIIRLFRERFGIHPQERAHLAPDGFDAVFIDGDHSEEAVTHDIALAARLLSPGGAIILHDVNVQRFGVGKAVTKACLLGNLVGTVLPTSAGDGFAILEPTTQKEGAPTF